MTAPTYEEVCTGKTGHSEVVMIAYDPGRFRSGKLLDIFFNTSDPCTRQQGEYAGTQYGPVIFCHDDQDKQWRRSISANYVKKDDARRG